MPVILKCQQCGSLFDRDVYPSCPRCGGEHTQPAFKVDYSGTGYNGSVSSPFKPPPPTPSPFHLLPSAPEVPPQTSPPPTFSFNFNFTPPPPTSSPFTFGSTPGFSFGASPSPQPEVQRKSKRFTHQLIIAVLTGNGDSAIETIARNLQNKYPGMSSLVHVHLKRDKALEPASHDLVAISTAAKEAIQNATHPENKTENAATVEKLFRINLKKAPGRLYLVAHGDDGCNFAGLPGGTMAAFIRNKILAASPIPCISVVSCYGAGYIRPLYNASESEEVNKARIDAAKRAPMDRGSFAAVFHRELKKNGILTEVLARRANVNTDPKTYRKGTRFDPEYNKYDSTAHQAPWSKFRFYWEGETQKVAPVYSDGDTSDWPQDLGS